MSASEGDPYLDVRSFGANGNDNATSAPAHAAARITTAIPTVSGGSPWPVWIEGRNDTILMAYGAAGDGKTHVTRSTDEGLSWQ